MKYYSYYQMLKCLFSMLINVKMPTTILGILKFMGMINFMLGCHLLEYLSSLFENSVDPDQTAPHVLMEQSDQGLHDCLHIFY